MIIDKESRAKVHDKSYEDLILDIEAAEKLEWESKQCLMFAKKRLSTLNYIILAFTFIGMITSSLWVEMFSYNKVMDMGILGTPLLLALSGLVAGLALVFMRERRQIHMVQKDAYFRLNLAVDLIRPLRDYLYSQADSSKLTPSQTKSIKLRLSRFPMDRKQYERDSL